MKCFVLILCFCASAVFAIAQDAPSQQGQQQRILIAFFSHTNNTRAVAEMIQRQVGGDLFHIAPKTPYPSDHQRTVNMARRERDENARPELAASISEDVMEQYDIVFLGYPNWWMTMPMAVRTFLDAHDVSGKTIAPFCTHEGSGLSNTVAELRQMLPDAQVVRGLAVNGRRAASSQNDVSSWLRELGFRR